jgi:hypothetical protein
MIGRRSMRFARKVRLLVPVALLVAAVAGAGPARAAAATATNLVGEGLRVRADVELAVFGINLVNSGKLEAVNVVFMDVATSNFSVSEDLAASNAGGVAVYRDSSKTGANQDVLDPEDAKVSTGFTSSDDNVRVSVSSQTPSSGTGEGQYTYFVAIRTSTTIADGDDFRVRLPQDPVGLNGTFETTALVPVTLASDVTTGTIAADLTPPEVVALSLPANVDGNVVWTLSEDVMDVDRTSAVLRPTGGADLPAAVTYDPETDRVTLDPVERLARGVTYVAVLAPEEGSITDQAGNPLATFARSFRIDRPRHTPALVSGNVWMLNEGLDSFTDSSFAFGRSTDVKVVGDWDGDGVFTPGVVRGNVWYLDDGFDGVAERVFSFGRSTDRPIVGDWDGDGIWTPGVVRGNVWYLNDGFDGVAERVFAFGRSTDRPIVGDWDGNGSTTPGVVRGNVWYLNNAFTAVADVPAFAYGSARDVKVAGDWDGDGVFTPGVVRGGTWYLNEGLDGVGEIVFPYGTSADLKLVGDWNGPRG